MNVSSKCFFISVQVGFRVHDLTPCVQCLVDMSLSSCVSRWTMRMLARLILGLFVLKAVVANPRFARQLELDTYDSANYDVDLENLNLENQDVYDYEDGLTIDEPQVRYWGEIGGMGDRDAEI